jgi:hypothetical protein
MVMVTTGVCVVGLAAAFVSGRAFPAKALVPGGPAPLVTIVSTAAWRGMIGSRSVEGAAGRATYPLDMKSPCAVVESSRGVLWVRLDTAGDTLRPWTVGKVQTVCLMAERR